MIFNKGLAAENVNPIHTYLYVHIMNLDSLL